MTSTLVLGGARSGKSRYALEQANAAGIHKVFVATAEALDEEMASRIEKHQAERDDQWSTIEAPLELAAAIENSGKDDCLVVDCLTLWLSNLMHAEKVVPDEVARLSEAIRSAQCELLLVSNEIGFGLVPESPLGREFRDEQGRLNQAVASTCDRVVLVAAGLPLVLKP